MIAENCTYKALGMPNIRLLKLFIDAAGGVIAYIVSFDSWSFQNNNTYSPAPFVYKTSSEYLCYGIVAVSHPQSGRGKHDVDLCSLQKYHLLRSDGQCSHVSSRSTYLE